MYTLTRPCMDNIDGARAWPSASAASARTGPALLLLPWLLLRLLLLDLQVNPPLASQIAQVNDREGKVDLELGMGAP